MRLKIKSILAVFILLTNGTSCIRSVDCDNCTDNLKTIWSYKLRLPLGMLLSDGELIVQNNNSNNILLIDAQTGVVNRQLSTKYDKESGSGAVVSIGLSKELIVYEQVVDYKKSYIKIYNRVQHRLVDSVPISLHNDLTASHGIAKIYVEPLINDSTVLYTLNDGTLNAYNFLNKKISWTYNLNAIPIRSSIIITKDHYVHIQLPSHIGSGFEIITLLKQTGALVWKRHFDGQAPLQEAGGKLLGVNDSGRLIYINSANGEFSGNQYIIRKPYRYRIINELACIIADNNVLVIRDLAANKELLKYKLCDEIIGMNYSKKLNSFFLVDKTQHCIQVNLSNWSVKCIQQFVDTYPERNFLIEGDSLFINKSGALKLFKL